MRFLIQKLLRKKPTLLLGLFCTCLLFASGQIGAQDRAAHVLLDSREGIGLLPNMWRGMTLQTGDVPQHMTLRTVCLGPEPVAHAWAMRRRGGQFDWAPLDRALANLRARKVDVVLVLPVSQYEDPHWVEVVTETARHVGDRVSLFEFRMAPEADLDRYLEHYESAVWAIRQLGLNVRLGGPGAQWSGETVSAFIQRCALRKLPLNTITWQVSVTEENDLRRSIETVDQLLYQYPLEALPGRLITGWGVTERGFGVGMTALMQVMTTEVEAICLADTTDTAGWTAMKGLSPISGVRLPVVIQAPDGGVTGIAHLDYDTVLAVFWHARQDGQTPMTITYSGLPWGDHIRVEQLRLMPEHGEFKTVFSETRPFREPFSVNLSLTGDAVTAVRLVVE